jgi:hypothetical protein
MMPLIIAAVVNKKRWEERPIIMTQDTIQNRRAYCWFACQKCKSSEAAGAPLVIVPRQLIILCEDCFLLYSKIFPVEDREFV